MARVTVIQYTLELLIHTTFYTWQYFDTLHTWQYLAVYWQRLFLICLIFCSFISLPFGQQLFSSPPYLLYVGLSNVKGSNEQLGRYLLPNVASVYRLCSARRWLSSLCGFHRCKVERPYWTGQLQVWREFSSDRHRQRQKPLWKKPHGGKKACKKKPQPPRTNKLVQHQHQPHYVETLI